LRAKLAMALAHSKSILIPAMKKKIAFHNNNFLFLDQFQTLSTP